MTKKKETVKSIVEKAIVDCFNFMGTSEATIFVDIMAHIDGVSFRVYKNGWKDGESQDYIATIYLDSEYMNAKLCKELLKPIYKLINKNK